MARCAKGIGGLVLLAAILTTTLGGHASPVSPQAAHADVMHAQVQSVSARKRVAASRRLGPSTATTCPMAVGWTGYVDPLIRATVKPERIDQGVDYAGSGTLAAIGAARISYLASDGAGWPGAFIEYQLLTGPDAGCYVFYAEGVTPKAGLRVGGIVKAGQPIARIIPLYATGFEIGWGAGTGTKTYAALTGGWTAEDDQDNVASGPGKSFSALIASLGGPPGKVEG